MGSWLPEQGDWCLGTLWQRLLQGTWPRPRSVSSQVPCDRVCGLETLERKRRRERTAPLPSSHSGRSVVDLAGSPVTCCLLRRVETVSPCWRDGVTRVECSSWIVARCCCHHVLKGGAPAVPGERFCQVCQRGGCWQARMNCFGCGCKRQKGLFRERQGLGRQPPQKSEGCAPQRHPPLPQGARRGPTQLNQQHLSLGGLGVPNELMQQLRERLTPALVPEKPSKCLMDLDCKLDTIKAEKVRLISVWQKNRKSSIKRRYEWKTRKRISKQLLKRLLRPSKKWLVRLLRSGTL